MEERLSALFESRVGKVEQEMKRESERMRGESERMRRESERMRVDIEEKMRVEMKTEIEKQRVESEKEIESLRSNMAQLRDDNTQLNSTISQLKIDNARLTTDLTEIHNDLRILHPLPYARLHLQKCITHQIACNDAVNAFIDRYTLKVIIVNTSLSLQLQELKKELKKAWDARFAAAFLCDPRPTLANVLWIVAKSGFTQEVAPLMNLSKATRECKDLQREMRDVRNEDGQTQLYYYCHKGMTASVVRMLEMRSIDVEAKGGVYGATCLMEAARNGHLDICRLLIDKGAQLEATYIDDGWTPLCWAASGGHLDICRLLLDKGAQLEAKADDDGTPLHFAAAHGQVEIVRLLCDRGADVEARDEEGVRPLHDAARMGHILVVKELIEERNAEINARDNNGKTALRWARDDEKPDVAAFLDEHGGIE